MQKVKLCELQGQGRLASPSSDFGSSQPADGKKSLEFLSVSRSSASFPA
jgi:hypothetical protein